MLSYNSHIDRMKTHFYTLPLYNRDNMDRKFLPNNRKLLDYKGKRYV